MGIVVIGTGTMAAGIAAGFIAAGFEVVVLGRDADRAGRALSDAHRQADALASSAGRLAGHAATIAAWDRWDDVTWVVESVVEDLAVKRALFEDLDRRVPPAIPIGSNSSGFPITRIAGGLPTARRMFNAHYFMPAHLVPLVEVALGEASDPVLGESICALYRRIGKRPVLVKKDIPGFLANRMQHALMRELLALVDSGIASPADVDAAVRYSFGFRYAAAGPVLQKEISGWESMARAAAEIYPSLSNATDLAPCVAALVADGKTGMKAGQGFMSWTPESSALERAAYEERLKAAFDVLQRE